MKDVTTQTWSKVYIPTVTGFYFLFQEGYFWKTLKTSY